MSKSDFCAHCLGYRSIVMVFFVVIIVAVAAGIIVAIETVGAVEIVDATKRS